MKKSVQSKRAKEKDVVEKMIRIYCRHQHGGKKTLCADCQALLDYANWRVDVCPLMESKTFCSRCRVHCYKPEMQTRIKQVMRFSGPRMIFYHPVLAVSHVLEERKAKKNDQ